MLLKFKKYVCLFLFLVSGFSLFASSLDSLLFVLGNTDKPRERIEILRSVFNQVLINDAEQALGFAQQELVESIYLEDSLLEANAYLNIGLGFDYQNKFDSAVFYYLKAYDYFNDFNNYEGKARALLNVGIVSYFQGNYSGALRQYFKVVSIQQDLGNENKLASVYSNIGVIYVAKKEYEKALTYYNKSLQMDKNQNDEEGIAKSYNNIGIVYRQLGNNAKALEAYFMSLNYKLRLNDKNGVANTYNNIAILYQSEGDYAKALKYSKLAYSIEQETGDERSLAGTQINMGETYLAMGESQKALSLIKKGVETSERVGNLEYLKSGYDLLSEVYKKSGDYKKAYKYFVKYSGVKDSLMSFEKSKELNQLETQFKFDQKDKEIELLKRQQQIDKLKIRAEEKELEKKSVYINSLILGLFFVLVIAFLAFNRYHVKRKANKILSSQNKEIRSQKEQILLQKDLLEEKNNEITDSINYAQRIQEALFQSLDCLTPSVADSFILFKPKDIVSGDFYWTRQKGNYLYVTVADCTGHGVPGAFMSLLGNAFLGEILSQAKALTPAEVLDHLREKITRALGQSGELGQSKDGMDMSFCRIDLTSGEAIWAGANNPLWVISPSGDLMEYKPEKQPVGYYAVMNEFVNHHIKIEKGSRLYMFTDGYADQFGGEKGKKLKYKAFKQAVLSSYKLDMSQQADKLNSLIEDWKGDLEQIDDICVMGIKV